MQDKTQKLSTSIEFYRVYFYEFMDLLKHKGKFKRSASLLANEENSDFHRFYKESLGLKSQEKDENKEKEVNVSILEEEKEKEKPKVKNLLNNNFKGKLSEGEIEEHENVNYKAFLLNLAKELYTNPNVRSFFSVNKDLLKKMEIQNFKLQDYKFVIKPKRTLSNPLIYISDSIKSKLQQPPLKSKKNRISNNNLRLKRMFSKGLSPMRGIVPNEIKTGMLPLFNLDVSKIAGPMDNLELSFDAKINDEGIFFLG